MLKLTSPAGTYQTVHYQAEYTETKFYLAKSASLSEYHLKFYLFGGNCIQLNFLALLALSTSISLVIHKAVW